jgi:hypothetical protein
MSSSIKGGKPMLLSLRKGKKFTDPVRVSGAAMRVAPACLRKVATLEVRSLDVFVFHPKTRGPRRDE